MSPFGSVSSEAVFQITGVVTGVLNDIPAWPGREREDSGEKAYFGIVTADRVVEFECKSKGDKQMWTEGIQQMLNYCSNMI